MKKRDLENLAIEVFSSRIPKDKILADYDSDADVLYVNFLESSPQEADFGRKFGDYIIRFKNKIVIGITIINAIYHSDIRFIDVPSILWHI